MNNPSQIQDFSKLATAFRDRMMLKGPGKCNDLDEGVALLKNYQVRDDKKWDTHHFTDGH